MSIQKQIATMQDALDKLKKAALDNSNDSQRIALAKIKLDKQRAIEKGQKVLSAASKYRDEKKWEFLTKEGFVKSSTLPDGTKVYGKPGMLLKIFISGETFTVKSGLSADAQVIQKKAPISKLYDYLQQLPKTQAGKMAKTASAVRFNAVK